MQKLIALALWFTLMLAGIQIIILQPISWSCKTSAGVGEIIFSPDNKTIVVTRQGFNPTDLWTLEADHALHPFETPGQTVLSVAIAPDGKTAASGNIDDDFGISTAYIWDMETGALLHTLTGHKYQITVAYSPDSKTLLTTSLDGTARLWDVSSGTLLHNLVGHTDLIYGGTFAPDGNSVLTYSKDTTARLWDVRTGALLFTLKHSNEVGRALFSPDGKTLITNFCGIHLGCTDWQSVAYVDWAHESNMADCCFTEWKLYSHGKFR